FNFYCIAVIHARDACGRSSRNQIAGIQSHDVRDVPYKKGDREGHVSRVTFLFYFSIETRLDRNIGWIDLSFDPRPDRAERVKRFATSKLHVFSLKIAGSDVVHARVTENIIQWIVA